MPTNAKPISAVLCSPAYRAHLLSVPTTRLARRPYPAALCGARPARTSKGWQRSATLPPCPRCAAAAGHASPPPPVNATAEKAAVVLKKDQPVVPRVQSDKSGDAYESRVLAAMERTMDKGAALTMAQQVGRDAGGGWIILGTDGRRALLRKGSSETKTVHQIVEAAPPRAGIDLTPELEGALRAVWKTLDRKRPTVWLTIDGRKRRLKIDPIGGGHHTVAITGAHVESIRLGVNLRWLLDGFGRGGRLGYATGKNGDRLPLVLDTSDKLRYVVMPVAPPAQARPAPASPEPPPAATAVAP